MAVSILVLFKVTIIILWNCSETHAVNVALNATVSYTCHENYEISKATDGIIDPSNYVEFVNDCNEISLWIQIKLREPRIIDFVTLIVNMEPGSRDHVLDYFKVKSESDKVCAYFPMKCLNNSQMRVNCKPNFQHVQYLYILGTKVPQNAEKIYVVEIEAHYIENTKVNTYIGCFNDPKSFEKSENRSKNCQSKCIRHSTNYAFVRGLGVCECAKYLWQHLKLSDSACTYTCGEEFNSCGGPNAFSVYSVRAVFPYIADCKQVPERDGMIVFNSSTITECIMLCFKDGYLYSYLQEMGKCGCSNLMSGARHYSCSEQCLGDKWNICGRKPDIFTVFSDYEDVVDKKETTTEKTSMPTEGSIDGPDKEDVAKISTEDGKTDNPTLKSEPGDVDRAGTSSASPASAASPSSTATGPAEIPKRKVADPFLSFVSRKTFAVIVVVVLTSFLCCVMCINAVKTKEAISNMAVSVDEAGRGESIESQPD